MTYDVVKERENTLIAAKKRERNAWMLIIFFISSMYICISCGIYKEKHPELSNSDVATKHFFDAILWKNSANKLKNNK